MYHLEIFVALLFTNDAIYRHAHKENSLGRRQRRKIICFLFLITIGTVHSSSNIYSGSDGERFSGDLLVSLNER